MMRTKELINQLLDSFSFLTNTIVVLSNFLLFFILSSAMYLSLSKYDFNPVLFYLLFVQLINCAVWSFNWFIDSWRRDRKKRLCYHCRDKI